MGRWSKCGKKELWVLWLIFFVRKVKGEYLETSLRNLKQKL